MQVAVRGWGVLRFPSSVSNGARANDDAPARCSDLHGTCICKRNGVRSARLCNGRFVGGAYSGARDPRQHGARARGTCSCSARQRPAHPNGPTLSELKTASRTLALERKRPVKPTELFELFKEFKVGVPKLGNVPTQTVHARPFRFVAPY